MGVGSFDNRPSAPIVAVLSFLCQDGADASETISVKVNILI